MYVVTPQDSVSVPPLGLVVVGLGAYVNLSVFS